MSNGSSIINPSMQGSSLLRAGCKPYAKPKVVFTGSRSVALARILLTALSEGLREERHVDERGPWRKLFMRTDVSFLTTDGVRLAGWLFLPEKIEGKLPAIVLSHGTGCVKEMGIAPYAEAFAKAGYVALLYDHRNFGESAGEPRAELDPWQQISDMKDAITYLSSLDQVDPDKIGLWGTSYSGGHSIVVTATDLRDKCIVAQVQTMSG